MKNKIYILGIESSCDETSVAVVTRNTDTGRPLILANIVKNQIDVHKAFGGLFQNSPQELIQILLTY